MRLSSFILGGLVGASALWVVQNRNHPIMNMMKMMSKDEKTGDKQTVKTANSQHTNQPQHSREHDISLIRSIISQDKQLQKQFDDIAKQNIANSDKGVAATGHNQQTQQQHH